MMMFCHRHEVFPQRIEVILFEILLFFVYLSTSMIDLGNGKVFVKCLELVCTLGGLS